MVKVKRMYPFRETFLLTLSASGKVYHPITFANSLDADKAQQNVRPDLDPSRVPLSRCYF